MKIQIGDKTENFPNVWKDILKKIRICSNFDYVPTYDGVVRYKKVLRNYPQMEFLLIVDEAHGCSFHSLNIFLFQQQIWELMLCPELSIKHCPYDTDGSASSVQ